MEVGNNGDHLMGDPVDRVKKGQARSASLPCRKQRYADQEFLASLGYIERPCLKTDLFFFNLENKQTKRCGVGSDVSTVNTQEANYASWAVS